MNKSSLELMPPTIFVLYLLYSELCMHVLTLTIPELVGSWCIVYSNKLWDNFTKMKQHYNLILEFLIFPSISSTSLIANWFWSTYCAFFINLLKTYTGEHTRIWIRFVRPRGRPEGRVLKLFLTGYVAQSLTSINFKRHIQWF